MITVEEVWRTGASDAWPFTPSSTASGSPSQAGSCPSSLTTSGTFPKGWHHAQLALPACLALCSSPVCVSAGGCALFLALVLATVTVICASWEAAVREAGSGPCNRLARTSQVLPEMTLGFAQGKVYSKKADVGSTGTQDSWHLLSLPSVFTSTELGWQVTAVTQCWQAVGTKCRQPGEASQAAGAKEECGWERAGLPCLRC